MFALIRDHQMNIMLALCAICAMMAVILYITRFLPKRRKWILILLELIATFLLAFDRAAYTYKGDVSQMGYVMVRLSNFMVFFLTSAIVLGFNLYVMDLLKTEAGHQKLPRRLTAVNIGAVAGMAMAVLSHFTGLYYTFDDQNRYQRGPGFLLCYIVPVVFPVIQYTVIRQYKRVFSSLIYLSLVLYIFVPILTGILQIFTYGLSIVNMAMVLVSVSLYIFTYMDINNEVMRAHQIEIAGFRKEQRSMKRLFEQTATAFVTAVEKRDPFSEGHSVRVAEYAKRIAQMAKKTKKESDEIYYTALLHDVGMIGIPDSVLEKAKELNEEEYALVKKKPELSAEILSSVTEYPYLSRGVRYTCERYDGSGYPEGLSGQDIPEISRIIAVADAYDTMSSPKCFREPLPHNIVREEFIKQAGVQFDPVFSEIMVQIMDEELSPKEEAQNARIETELVCGEYRDAVSVGIPVTEEIATICFDCVRSRDNKDGFSSPAVILFDSYDRRVHGDARTIGVYRYLEYGEIWYDGHYISTGARSMEVHVQDSGSAPEERKVSRRKRSQRYEIVAGRYEDHLSLKMTSPDHMVEVIAALPDNSKASYIGLAGEHCALSNITVEKTGERMAAGDIHQIVSKISYIDRLESDVANVQVNRTRSAYTEGIPVLDGLKIDFHTMTLPQASLVWHCPYIVLFSSEDGKVGGSGYCEYALVKINGELEETGEYAENHFSMKRSDAFPGWEAWKEANKAGMECSFDFMTKGGRVTIRTENMGISIENTTIPRDGIKKLYAALTGDQVALTDIRVH